MREAGKSGVRQIFERTEVGEMAQKLKVTDGSRMGIQEQICG